MKRRNFIRTLGMGMIAAGVGVTGSATAENLFYSTKNKLPRWRGFNLLDYFSPYREAGGSVTTDQDLKWMADWGFDFVRLPIAYPRYIIFDPSRDITPDDVLHFDEKEIDNIQSLVERANDCGLHVSLNLHRAPGFCVNAGFNEPYNLWKDKEAQEAFYEHWSMWAKRFKHLSPREISFDLVNEPCLREDMNDQHSQRGPVPGQLYREVAQKSLNAIRQHNPQHLVIADGNNVGNDPIPEIFDLDIGQSCRGYYPHYISHYRAPWVWKNPDEAPKPVWPGVIDGKYFNRKILEEFYAPWIDAVNKGVGVHCGECGCWKETPHEVFLAWFEDVLDILTQHGIGYALWNFRGDFGILDSGRKDVKYEDWYGHRLDRELLTLLRKY
ncbi:MAG: endoglucanase [Bacteroidota bacterium]|nr:glycosyl hydrolase family 5 [Methermicoccus sp.]MBZ4674442.1 glycosyl hydrolase family 5 [Dysgonamonadaceae bacterium]MDK2969451.1 endoglucanase [Bacteroidota bacterium]MDN5296135.1 endoglucanase [Bacteroidota bacterium]PLB86543.1 glycosyl hydrolase family 5 [Dysgonamonadaceae bacterium]